MARADVHDEREVSKESIVASNHDELAPLSMAASAASAISVTIIEDVPITQPRAISSMEDRVPHARPERECGINVGEDGPRAEDARVAHLGLDRAQDCLAVDGAHMRSDHSRRLWPTDGIRSPGAECGAMAFPAGVASEESGGWPIGTAS